MKITVAILTFNSSKTIVKCLSSLELQAVKNFNVIIVDDKSNDNTLLLIKKLTKKLSFEITIYHNGARNISRGRNIAIKNCKTDFIAFMDSDAYADIYWTKYIEDNFLKNRSLTILGGSEIIIYINKFSHALSINDNAINRISNDIWKTKGLNFAININLLNEIYFNEKFIHNDETEFIFRTLKLNKNYQYLYDEKMIVYHQARNTLKKYIRQVYMYGIWRVIFSFYAKKFRSIDFIPTILLLFSLILSFYNPLFIFSILFFSLLETLYIIFKSKSNFSLIYYLYLGWLIKNVGWGLGILVGLVKVMINRNLINSLNYSKPL